MIILQPMGPNGVAVESKAPLKHYHADMLVISVDFLRILIFSSICTKRLSHIYLGKLGSTPARIAKNVL